MTKVKVKGSVLSIPLERGRPAAVDEEEDEQGDFAGKKNYVPLANANYKEKGSSRGAGRPTHRDSLGLQSDSALWTSSSRGSDDDDDDDDVGGSAHYQAEQHYGSMDNTPTDSACRGSIRVKVTPSKFREKQLQSHTTLEGRPPLKKNADPLFDSTGFKQLFQARDYAFADRQQELSTALMVVRKIVKMEAAEPFKAPVDPVALGIPDYFDIVKRPMDLGTICKNLERGGKYRSSRDVYEDVQLVWTNCRIYNQKGDPILELLARVKKNFMKYWTAAGLYTEKSPGYEQEVEQKPGGRGLIIVKHPPHADKIVKQKDVDLQGTPGKLRRISGTGHHKADCSCVVCTGVRRKLAREGKLPSHLVNLSGTAESPVAQERILVRLKAEGSGDQQKTRHGSDKTKEGKRKEIEGKRTEYAPLKKTKLDDLEMVSMDADSEKTIERDEDGKVAVEEEGKGYSESEGKLESVKAGSEEEYKGAGEEMDDREGGDDEQLADMLETELQEGGVTYYRASYEMPLRKINPSILQSGKKLFGSGSPWNHGRSLSRQSLKRFSENPIHATVSLLLSSKAA